jgi:Tfp pilus assembly protein PilO
MSSADFQSFAQIAEKLKDIKKGDWVKIGIVTVLAAVFIVFIAWPAWMGRMDDKGRIMTMRGRITNFETLKRAKGKMMEERKNASEFIQKAKAKMLTASEASLMLGAISKLANEAGVTIIASSPRDSDRQFPPPYNQFYQATFYDVAVEGGYHQIGKFVQLIETNPKSLKIDRFHIAPKSTDRKEGNSGVEVVEITISSTAHK